MPPEPIQTERLLLRRFNRRDVGTLHRSVEASLPELQQWLPWARPDYNRGDAAAYIRDSISAWKDDKAYDYSVRWKTEPDRHIGNVSIWALTRIGHIGEIGYWVHSGETGRGVITEACRAMVEVGFTNLHLHKINLRIAAGNTASERVADKLGFTRDGVLREELRLGGRWVDHTIYSLLIHEWRQSPLHHPR
ncbi:MAG: GNAT family N-acetyltransferase [Acidimicrobiia bacterium]|nr:GNAT family N-acetyltransferase [Acidimicrobiia bacterium]